MARHRRNVLELLHSNLSLLVIALLVCRTQTQLLTDKCWFTAPTIAEDSINIQVVTRNSTTSLRDGLTSSAWNITATITWSRPTDLKKGGAYVVKLNQIPSFVEPSFCEVGSDETIVRNGEQYTFYNLEFGFLYEFTVYVYNVTKSSKALEGTTRGFATPDCFQATGDRRFCSGEEVEFAGAPIEPILNHLCQNDSLVRATISWFPPIQYNGDLTSYGVQHAELGPRGLLKSETAYVIPETNRGPDGRIYYTIIDLQPGLAYLIEITPYVTTQADTNTTDAGLVVEMTFIASAWQGPEPTGPASLLASPDTPTETLPICPPDSTVPPSTTKITTQPPKSATTSTKRIEPSPPLPEAPTIIDEGGIHANNVDNAFEIAAMTTTKPPPAKPVTVTVKVLVKEQNSNKAIAVVVSLLLCAILLAIIWLGIKVLKGRGSSTKKSTSVVVTDTGNKTADKAEEAAEV
ncbi:uncharacterized protein [Amphiura filiformis]|uniref:uncharacterized protein n=1 Tax=Amphiura filiformis TaxID=82378 RepID=UPI003B20C7AF